jgi:hypothetical protein
VKRVFPKYDPRQSVRRGPSSVEERREVAAEEERRIRDRVEAEYESRRRSLEEMRG